MQNNRKLVRTVLASIFAAIIIVMTFIPNFGYISTGVIEITTIHIMVILSACVLGPWFGAFEGAVWGITCLIRAFTNPLWIMFTNPLISVVPRILVGLLAGLIFAGLKKTKLNITVSLIIVSILGTLFNTVFVLSSMALFGETIDFYMNAYKLIKTIMMTLVSINCPIEVALAAILIPIIYRASEKEMIKYKI